jgi:hypothetical protein
MPVTEGGRARRSPKNATVPPQADRDPLRVCESSDYVDPRNLVPLEDNPRTLSDEKRASLTRSIRDLGLFRPLLVWKRADGPVVIGGNQKLSILQDIAASGSPFVLADGSRVPGVPVTWFEGDEARARIVALRDNNADGDWDYPGLSEYLRNLQGLDGFDEAALGLTGFDDALLGDLVQAYVTVPDPAPQAAPPEPAPPATHAPLEAPLEPAPGPQPSATPNAAQPPPGAAALSDPAEQLIGVVIGHVRGKIKAPTYQRLVQELSKGHANGIPDGGLDAAVVALLARLIAPA